MIVNVKVSGTDWLCVQKANNEWLPVFKLSPPQLREYVEAERVVRASNAAQWPPHMRNAG